MQKPLSRNTFIRIDQKDYLSSAKLIRLDKQSRTGKKLDMV